MVQRRLALGAEAVGAVRSLLVELDPTATGDDLQIVAAELIGNAFRHGRPFEDGTVALRVAWGATGTRIDVTDAGSGAVPALVDTPPDREGRRGLAMIDRLASAWGYRSEKTTSFWAELGSTAPRAGTTGVLATCRRMLSDEVSPPLDVLLDTVATGMVWPLVEYRTRGVEHLEIRAGAGAGAPTPADRAALDGACRAALDSSETAVVPVSGHVATAMTVVHGGHVIGILGVVCPEAEADAAVELLLWISGLIAPVLGREETRQTEDFLVAQLAFLARASEVLASSLDYDSTLEQVARLLVPERADWCTINLINEDGSIRRVAAEHARPDRRGRLLELLDEHPHDPDADTGVPLVIRTGEPRLYPEVSDDLLKATANDPEYLEITRDLAIRSCIIVPLETRGQVLGTISLVSTDLERFRYGESDLAMARDLARRAALAIDNARIHTSRSRVAQALQESLLPAELPEIPGVDVAVRYQPASSRARMGGDFYDIVGADDGSWYVVIGDVQGKGIEAATLIGLARHTLRTAALQRASPAAALEMLNTALHASSQDRSCTAICARLVPTDRTWAMTIARAGHVEPILLQAGGSCTIVSRGLVLGLFSDPMVEERTIGLSAGQSVVLLTDGAIGVEGDAEARLRSALEAASTASAQEIAAGVPRAHDVDDDLAVVVLQPVSAPKNGAG